MSMMSLWLPIVVSAVVVWVASALIWTTLPWHRNDFSGVSDEEGARNALRGLTPGLYNLPHLADRKELQEPEARRKFEEGPLAYITVVENGLPRMGGKLIAAFVYYLFVGMLCAYVVTRTGTAQSPYLEVFRVSGTVAFVAYGVAYIQESIWFGRPWAITAKSFLDAIIYALLTGGVFGWLVAG